jgi:hypothetical protein
MPSHSILPPGRADWSKHEQTELDRLRDAFSEERYEVECSHTDEGDPWCVVHDKAQQEVVVHITRLGRVYIVFWPEQRSSTQTTSLSTAIDMAIGSRNQDGQPGHIPN